MLSCLTRTFVVFVFPALLAGHGDASRKSITDCKAVSSITSTSPNFLPHLHHGWWQPPQHTHCNIWDVQAHPTGYCCNQHPDCSFWLAKGFHSPCLGLWIGAGMIHFYQSVFDRNIITVCILTESRMQPYVYPFAGWYGININYYFLTNFPIFVYCFLYPLKLLFKFFSRLTYVNQNVGSEIGLFERKN